MAKSKDEQKETAPVAENGAGPAGSGPIRQLKLPVSGETVNYVPFSQVAAGMLLKASYPRPKPPRVKVNVLGKETIEHNWADPDYADMLQEWEGFVNELAYDMLIRRQEMVQELDDEKREKVRRLRELYDGVVALPDDDLKVWFYSIALTSNQDLWALTFAARSAGEPTEELIEAEAAGF